jgi:hypothetical protein
VSTEKLVWMALSAAVLTACKGEIRAEEGGTARQVIDSVIPREEAVRRFRRNLPEVARLEGGEGSAARLITAVMRALETRDSAALERLAINRGEFGWLYYPTATQGLPPYNLEPGLVWFLLTKDSEHGLRRTLTAYGGQKVTLLGHDCGAKVNHEGKNTIRGPCTVRWRDQRGDVVAKRLVNQIIERDGRHKVLSYGNKL